VVSLKTFSLKIFKETILNLLKNICLIFFAFSADKKLSGTIKIPSSEFRIELIEA